MISTSSHTLERVSVEIPAPPCVLTTEGILAYLKSLGQRPPADDVLDLAWHVATRQIEIAEEEWDQYQLYCHELPGTGLVQWGVINPEGELRLLKKSYTGTHWHVETPFMPAISKINSALSDIEFRYAHRAGQVAELRPNPKHVYIVQYLYNAAYGGTD